MGSGYSNMHTVDAYFNGENRNLLAAEAEEEGEEGLDSVIEEERIEEEAQEKVIEIKEAESIKSKKNYQHLAWFGVGALAIYLLIRK